MKSGDHRMSSGVTKSCNRSALAINRFYWDKFAEISEESQQSILSRIVQQDAGTLRDIEVEEIGDVQGCRLVHLQCHDGVDTISWARLGANAVGTDFSETAII